MVTRRYSNRLYGWLADIGKSPSRILEILQYLCLAWVLLLVLAGFGGFLPYGQPMVGASWWLLGLGGLHALCMLFRNERPGLGWEMLLPLPFIAYAWVHYQFLSPAPWLAATTLAMWVQAYALYILVFNSIRGSRAARAHISICQLVVGVALMVGIFQFYLFPNWMPDAARARNPGYASGVSGFIQDPANLGALMVLFFSLSIVLTRKHYRTGPTWILQAFYGFILFIGTLMASHRPGLAALVGMLVVLPFFLTGHRPNRRKFWICNCIGLPVVFACLWLGTQELRERISHYIHLPPDPLAQASREVAMEAFRQNPVAGQGLGAFAFQWDAYSGQFSAATSVYPASAYASLLAETGVLGLLLAAAPFGLLLARAWSQWRKTPYTQLDKELSYRMSQLPAHHRSRRRMEREKGYFLTRKALLGGLLLGFLGYAYYIGWDDTLKLPVVVFLLACLAAVMAWASRSAEHSPAGPRLGLATALLPLLLFLWAVAFGVPRHYAAHLAYTAGEQLEHLTSQPDRIFRDTGALSEVEATFDIALRADPSNADAWTGLGSARLARLHANTETVADTGRAAEAALGRAAELAPLSWLASYNMARALLLQGADIAVAKSWLESAVAAAPARPEPAGLLGSLLLLRDPRSQEGLALLQRSLASDPGYRPSAEAMRRHGFVAGSDPDTTRQLGILTETVLAEQFRVVARGPERVLGAGLPKFDER